MNDPAGTSTWPRWFTVVVFAIAMAWVESAVVYYLRTHIDRIEPYQANPLPLIGDLGPVELVRELATMIMLFTVGWLAGRTWRARFGYIGHRVRRVGHFLLRLSEGDVRLAAFAAGLGHSVPAAVAVVGAGARADVDRDPDDLVGHAGQPV